MIIILCCSLSTVAAEDISDAYNGYDISLDQDDSILTVETDGLDGDQYDDMGLSTNDNMEIKENDHIVSSGSEENIIDESTNDIFSDSDSSNMDDALNATGRYGVVDFGSNIISLNIYDIENGVIVDKKSMTETSPTSLYTVDKKLTPEGIEYLISILSDFNNMIDLKDVKAKSFFATASMRKIDNSEEVKAIVYERLGINIEVLTEVQEATIGFNAVRDTDLTTDSGLLIDLGGGSCEFTHFENKEIVTAESKPFGSNSCFKEFVSALLPNEAEASMIESAVLANMSELEIDTSHPYEDLFGTGGSIYTIKLMLIYLGWVNDDVKFIPVSMLDDLYDELKDGTKETYQKIISVDANRIHTLLPGLIITRTILDYFQVQRLHFCQSTLEDGLLTEVIKKENNKESVILNIKDINTTSDEDIAISISLASDAQGTVKIELNNATYISKVINGKALINTPKLNSGDYIAKIVYTGDEKYKSAIQNVNIHIKSVKLDVSNLKRGYNSNYDFTAKLLDEYGNPIRNKLVTFTVAKKTYYAMTNDKGIAYLKAKLNVGTYNVTVSSPFNSKVTKTLKIIKRVQSNKNMVVYYNSNKKVKVKIIADNGSAEGKAKSVKVTIDKKTYTFKTDKNGYITIILNKTLLVGKHNIKIQYKGYSVQNKITVKQVLTSKKTVRIKRYSKKLVLSAKLKNVKNIKNQKISFRFNGKTYSAKTNSKGIAKVTIKRSVLKKLKKGKTYTVSVRYLKDIVKTKVTVK